MNAKLKAFIKTGRGKLTLAVGALALVWIVLLWQFAGSLAGLLPGAGQIDRTERQVKDLRRENAVLKGRVKAVEELKARFRSQVNGYWQETRDGLIDSELRNRIQKAAREVNLTFNSLGSVRVSRINDELYYAEIDLSASGTIGEIVAFLAKISKSRPVLSWRRFDLRPEPLHRRPQNTAGASGSTAVTEQKLNFNGVIRVIGYDGTAKKSGGGRK